VAFSAFLLSLAQWPFDPAVIIGVVISAALHWRGVSDRRAHGLGRHLRPWRAALFALAAL